MAAKLKSHVLSAFKMHGFTLRSESSKYLVEVLAAVSDNQREECLDKIIETIQKQPLSSSLLSKAICETAVQECNAEHDDEGENVLCVIDAFSVPRLSYVADRKKFIHNKTLRLPEPSLHGMATDKATLFRDRYTLLYQRTQRHDLFTPPAIGSQEEQSKKFQLKPIEFLLGSNTKLGEIIVLGMLTQLKEACCFRHALKAWGELCYHESMTEISTLGNKWYLEDPTGAVNVDLSKANFHSGLFTENCFVLAEGWYEDSVFHINAFGFPPPEPAKTTRSYFGNVNFFGGLSNTSVKGSARLKQIEEDNPDAMFVFLSDVWLDQVKVLEMLRILFTGYAEFPPVCFVMCGNFLSMPYGAQHAKVLKEAFSSLTDLINEFPSIVESSRFIFVPGPQDPGPSAILPRPAIPSSITEEVKRRIPSAVFTSNPCRIQYCTQQIVVFREDIVTKMCRNCVKFPEDGDVPTHFAKTLICQGHLCPLPLHVCPVYWSHDVGLRLYPIPDLVVCADKFDPFHTTSVDCTVMNPGSFPRTDYAFKVYLPATRQVEDSKIGGADS